MIYKRAFKYFDHPHQPIRVPDTQLLEQTFNKNRANSRREIVFFALVVSILAAVLCVARTSVGQEATSNLPEIVQHANPIYPAIAKTAHVYGDVVVDFKTDGSSVIEAEAVSGPPLLRKAAEDNVRTWKFTAHNPGNFEVTFRYKLFSESGESVFPSAAVVEVLGAPAQMIIDYAWLDLGKWRAQLRSSRGTLLETFDMRFTGPNNGEWLDGEAIGRDGAETDFDSGYRDGDFLAFRVKLRQPDRHVVSTFLSGKIIGNRIVGTFVDEIGITGEWTAVLQQTHPN